MKIRAKFSALLFGFLVAFVAIPSSHGWAASQTSSTLKIDIPYNALAYSVLPLWVAIDAKLFEHYGVEAHPAGAMRSPAVVASVLSGETLFAVVGEDAVIAADLNGGNLVMLTADAERLLLGFEASPKIHSVADLKGKRLGISRSGTTTDFLAHYVLQRAGLRPGVDTVLLPVGSLSARVAALESGQVSAVVIGPPIIFKTDQMGFHSIANMIDYNLPFYTSTLIAKKSWIAAHPAETLNVVRGYCAGVAAVFRHKKQAIAVLAKYTKIKDPVLLDDTYKEFIKVLEKAPMPKPAAIRTGLERSKLPAAKAADPTSFINPSFVKRLDKSGFIASLYK